MFPDIAAAAKIRGTSRSIYLSLTLTSQVLRQCRFLLRSAPRVDNYLSGNKSVSGVRLNHYKLSDDGRHLEIDLSIILYRETKGDIRPFAKFVISILGQNDFL